jgi:hypothetical protein
MDATKRIGPLLALSILFATGGLRAQDDHPVTIHKTPEKVLRRMFDPAHPPSAMPALTPPESGVCHFDFGCDAGIGVFVDPAGPNSVEVEVDSVDVILTMEVDIWAINGAPKKLLNHEEGHRQICEYYYKDADAIAQKLGKSFVGRKAVGTGPTKQAATDDAEHKLLSEYNTDYMNATRVRCSACQVRYDAITMHGLNDVLEADAIAQAIKAEPAP